MVSKMQSTNIENILFTGTTRLANKLSGLLQTDKFRLSHIPLIEIRKIRDSATNIGEACQQLRDRSWLVFTSQNSVDYLADVLTKHPKLHMAFGRKRFRVACVGHGTRKTAEQELGADVEFVPSVFTGRALAAKLPWNPNTAANNSVWVPGAELMVSGLDWRLRARGFSVRRTVLYKTSPVKLSKVRFGSITHGDSIIVFCSPSAIGALQTNAVSLGADPALGWLVQRRIACLGNTTSQRLEELGIRPSVLPEKFEVKSLADAIHAQFKKSKPGIERTCCACSQ